MSTQRLRLWTGSLFGLALASAALASPALAQTPPWTEDVQLSSGDSAPGDLFGGSVAASGDTVVVGAQGRTGTQGSGAAYVFVRNGASWSLQQKLVSSDIANAFGNDVAIDGDTIAVSDTFTNGQRGAVYVFTRSGSAWTLQQKLAPVDLEVASFFGTEMALSGDTLLVTASSDDEGGVLNVGTVFVFVRSGATWTLTQKLNAPSLVANSGFGTGLALDGDRTVIGGSNGTQRSVRIYERTAGGPFVIRTSVEMPSDAAFGFQLALEGDRFVASARGDDQVAVDAGAAYVYQLNVSNWIQVAKLLPNAVANDGYGFKLAMEGDLIVLGSTASDLITFNAGAAQAFVRDDLGTWTNIATLVGSDLESESGFSQGIAIEGGSVFVGAWHSVRFGPPGCDPRTTVCVVQKPGKAYEFVVGQVDTEAPELDIPFEHMTVEATSSAGAVVTFAFTATDDVDGSVDAVCTPESGSTFGFGPTVVTCTATDAAGNAASDSFTVHVADTTDPDAVCTDVVTECTGEFTNVTTSCTATDTVDPDPFTSSTAQAAYPVSSNTYQCSATDNSGNLDVDVCSVHVVDTVPPTCVAPPTLYTACTQEGGTYPGVFAIQEHLGFFQAGDACDMAGVSIAYSNIDLFPSGCQTGATSSITVTVRDEGDNQTSCSSDVVVYDNRAPLVTVPDPITLECDVTGGVSGSDANIAAWLSDATASDVCHDEALTNNAPAFFAVGSNLVSFTGIDSCGNDSTRNSSVSVVDTTAPAATCQDAVFECTGELTPVATSCGASDVCDGSVAVISDAAPSYALGQHAFACHAQDDSGNGGSASCQVTVVDTQAPVLAPIATTLEPVAVGTTVSASAAFSDACGTHTGTWTFGDGASSAAIVTAGSATGSHVYTTPGVYTLTLTLSDGSGNSSTVIHQYVVVFDPNGGYVTGSGVVTSPAGAYTPDPSLSGKANFGFLARYAQGAFVPDGHTHFRFRAADFVFQSDAYEWLVVAGPHAKYKGTGSVNGVAGYRFMLTATDGARPGGGGQDRLHLKVWAGSGGVIYDNEPGLADDASATYPIDGGNIVIHP